MLRDPETHAGTTIPLATQALTFNDLAALLSAETGRDVTYRPRPADDLYALLEKQGMDPAYAKGLAGSVVSLEAGELPLSDAVYDTVQTVTGQAPLLWPEFIQQRLKDLPA